MPTGPVNNLSSIVALLRNQLRTQLQGKQGPSLRSPATSGELASKRLDLRDIERNLKARLQSIDPDDPSQHRKAVRLFLEHVLQREYGFALTTDPKFHDMIDHVQSVMESDKTTAEDLKTLVAEHLAR